MTPRDTGRRVVWLLVGFMWHIRVVYTKYIYVELLLLLIHGLTHYSLQQISYYGGDLTILSGQAATKQGLMNHKKMIGASSMNGLGARASAYHIAR